MKWLEFLNITQKLPLINTEILLSGVSNPRPAKVQISRWEKAGKIIQLRRGIYLLAEPYRQRELFEPYIAAVLKEPSYISLEKALEFHGLIPEAVAVYTSVTPKRPRKFVSKVGVFNYQHIKTSLFWGYNSVTVRKQTAFIASPEKALLDLVYLKNIKVSADYLEEMRLQSLEKINPNILMSYAQRFAKPGILRAAGIIKKFIQNESGKEEEL